MSPDRTVRFLKLMLFIAVCFFVQTSCSDSLLDAAKSKYSADYQKIAETDEWLIKINNEYRIRKDRIEKDRELLVRWFSRPDDASKILTDKKLHAQYLESVLNQHLLIIQALKERAFDNEEFARYMWIAVRDAMTQYYVRKKFIAESQKKKPEPLSIEEKEKLIKKYEAMYKSIGVSDSIARTQASDAVLRDFHNAQMRAYENMLLAELKLGNKVEFKK